MRCLIAPWDNSVPQAPKGEETEMTEFTMDDMILVSVDDHVIEPPDAFTRHFPERLRSRAPRIETVDGKDGWLWEGKRYPSIGLNAVVGRPRSEYGMEPSAFAQLREGTYDVKARIDDMNVNGVAAAIWSTATRIPNVLQNLLGEGVLSASFIPVYAGLRAQKKDDEAREVAGAVFGILALVVMTSSLASSLLRWVAGGVAACAGVAAFALPMKLNILVAIAAAVALCLLLEKTPWGRAPRPEEAH